MSKTTVHIILFFIDIAAIFACLYVFGEYHDISDQLNSFVDSIVVQRPLGLYFVLIIVPIIHCSGLVRIAKKREKLANNCLITCFALLIISAFVFDSWVESKITNAGYYYCEDMSESMRMSEFKRYLRDDLECVSQD